MGSSEPGLVVVGIDGSAEARVALGWSVEAAGCRRAKVRVVRASMDRVGERLQAEVDDAVGFAEGRLGAGRVEGRLVRGSSVKVLLGAAGDADLIVVGTRSGPEQEGSPGSMVAALSDGALCPVVAVRSSNWADPILVGTDCSARCEPAVGFAFEQAECTGLPVTVAYCWQAVHGHDDESAVAARRAMLDEWLAGRIQPYRDVHPGVTVRLVVAAGRPIAALAALAPKYSLLVVGGHDRGQLGPLTESVSKSLLERAACSVVVVPR